MRQLTIPLLLSLWLLSCSTDDNNTVEADASIITNDDIVSLKARIQERCASTMSNQCKCEFAIMNKTFTEDNWKAAVKNERTRKAAGLEGIDILFASNSLDLSQIPECDSTDDVSQTPDNQLPSALKINVAIGNLDLSDEEKQTLEKLKHEMEDIEQRLKSVRDKHQNEVLE